MEPSSEQNKNPPRPAACSCLLLLCMAGLLLQLQSLRYEIHTEILNMPVPENNTGGEAHTKQCSQKEDPDSRSPIGDVQNILNRRFCRFVFAIHCRLHENSFVQLYSLHRDLK